MTLANNRNGASQAGLFTPEETGAQTSGKPARGRGSAAQDERDFVDFFMYVLTAPKLAMPGWEDSWRLIDRNGDCLLHRLIHAKEIFAEQQCTEFEAMAYISTATLAAPPSHDWYRIYAWLFCRWRPEQGKEVFREEAGRGLDSNQQEQLARLRQWIYRRQTEHIKAKAKREAALPATGVGAADPPATRGALVQGALFPMSND